MSATDGQTRPGSVAGYRDSIDLLRAMDVPTDKLAKLFQTSPANIRQVSSRQYTESTKVEAAVPISAALADYANEQKWAELRRKSGPRVAPAQRRKLLMLEENIVKTFSKYVATQEFLAGARVLTLYVPFVANATNPEVLRLRALLHENIGWFYTHSGRSESSGAYALEAMRSAAAAFDESLGDRRYLVQFSESALIVANSLLNARQPQRALILLNEADAANKARREPIGSEHYRQRATALFQMQQDDEAKKLYVQAREAGLAEPSELSDLDLEMSSGRQRYILDPATGLEPAMDLASRAESYFGFRSLQHAMTVHWETATALCTDSSGNIRRCFEHLRSVSPALDRFGHEATVNFLLSITPDLQLSKTNQNRWVRFLLYENAFRTK